MRSSEIFEHLRPHCVHLTRIYESVDENEIKKFRKLLEDEKIDEISFQELQDYLLFPLRLILRANKKSDVNVQVLQCMKYIFDNTLVTSWNMFVSLYMQLLALISSPDKTVVVLEVSEELKFAAVQCIQSMVIRSSVIVLEEMYKETFHLQLSHAVYVLLRLAENETSRNLKVISVETIGNFATPKDVDYLYHLASERIAAFLPGITSCFTRMITRDFHQGQVLIVKLLQTLQQVITITMSDNILANLHTFEDKTPEGNVKFNISRIERNEEWVKTTAKNLDFLIRKIMTLVCHSHWRVRLALVEFAEGLLMKCTSSLEICTSPLLEVLLILSVDDYQNVRNNSRSTLDRYSKCNGNIERRKLLDILEDDLHNLVIKLPRILKTQDEKQILSSVNLLLGYLHLFGPEIKHFLHSLPHQKRIVIALLHLAELEDYHLVEEVTFSSVYDLEPSEIQNFQWPKKTFKYFRSDQIYLRFQQICYFLGQNGDVTLLVDLLLEKMDVPLYCRQSILILNELLHGIKQDQNKEKLLGIISMLLELYLSSDFFKVKVSNYPDQPANTNQIVQELNIPVSKISLNTQQLCLILEGISNMAKVTGTDFKPFLIQTLFPLMEKAGSTSITVAGTARLALLSVSSSCDYKNLSSVITENADYIINMISLQLRQFLHSQNAVVVLQVALQLCTKDILPILEDTINEVFEILDIHHQQVSSLFMKFFHTLVNVIKRWHPPPVVSKESETKEERPEKNDGHNKVWENFLEYHKNTVISENFRESDENLEDSEFDNSIDEVPDVKEEKTRTPLHIKIIMNVLQRCVHLQSSKNTNTRILCLDVISNAVFVAKDYEDELLPAVHNLWSGFTYRFTNDDLVVFTKAFETLLALADTCGSFISQRTAKDVFPKLFNFLGKQCLISLGKDDTSAYRFTMAYKLQMKLVSELGFLSTKLYLEEKHVQLVLMALQPYLSSKQPETLQEAAKTTFKYLMKIDEDIVWFYLNNLCSPEPEMLPPHPCLHPVYFATPKDEYQLAVSSLLNISN